jgi:hypothetical protein
LPDSNGGLKPPPFLVFARRRGDGFHEYLLNSRTVMPRPPTLLISNRVQIGIVGLVAAVLAIGGFEAGRKTVDAAAVANREGKAKATAPVDPVSQKKMLLERDPSRISVRDIATVPFSELYDVLKSASREQLLAWAADLEQMPRGPRQRAAVGAYFKSLVQVDHHAAIQAVLQAKNLLARDAAIDGMMKAAPESIWAELAEMTAQLPYPGRLFGGEDVIDNWSRVDPITVSRFLESHSFKADQRSPDGEDARITSLLNNWGEIDPIEAKKWLEADASRQTSEALRAFVASWGRVDGAAAIEYAVANAGNPKFEAATNELAYGFVRTSKENATKLLLLLPLEKAKAALTNVVNITAPDVSNSNSDRPPDYQRPSDEIARWIGELPMELWPEGFGKLAVKWLDENAPPAIAWVDQLPAEKREQAIIAVCHAAAASTAEYVLALSSRLGDQRLRDGVVRGYARRLGTEWQSADEAISAMDISEADKAYLRELREQNGR